MRILAIDQSKPRTGWALWSDEDPKPIYGSEALGSDYTGDGQMCAKLHTLLSEKVIFGRIDAVFWENQVNNRKGFSNTSTRSIQVSSALVSHIQSWCFVMKRDKGWPTLSHGTDPIAWQRFFFSGKAPKGESKNWSMQRARQLGFNPNFNDEADALGILDYACDYVGVMPPWRAEEVLRPALGGRP